MALERQLPTETQDDGSSLPERHEAAPPLAQDFQAALVEQAYRQLPVALVVNPVNGLFLTVVLWGYPRTSALLLWLFLLVVVNAGLFLLYRSYKSATLTVAITTVTWKRLFVMGVFAAGLVWGAAAIIMFDPQSFPHQVFLVFVLGGMVAGSVPLLSAMNHAYAFFAAPVVIPIFIQMLLIGDHIHFIMGLMIGVFGLAMWAASVHVQHLFSDIETMRDRLVASMHSGEFLEHLLRLDPLTEIPNRRRFEEVLQKEWRRAKRENGLVSVITADIDHFKVYNDRYGHQAGDECLVKVAQALRQSLFRPGDVVARIGGEEFTFLLPGTSEEGAQSVAEHIHRQIEGLKIPHEASPITTHVTLSFGVASSEDAGISSPADLLRASDMALYEAKRSGRNRVRVL